MSDENISVTSSSASIMGNHHQYGGNITLTAGKGFVDHSKDGPPIDGKISFNLPDGREYMRIDPDGKCFVNGTLVATDVEAHTGFVNWLRSCGFHV